MPQVNVPINGRNYSMGCDAGEEDHLRALAARLDFKIAEMRVRFGEIGDGRLTIMAALTLADEASEAEGRAKRLEEKLTALQSAEPDGTALAAEDCDSVAAALEAIAQRIAAAAEVLAPAEKSKP